MLANLPHRDGRVFRTWRGEPFADIDDDRARRGSIKTAWASTLRRAGITEPLRIHDLQHGFSSWLTAMTMSFCQQQVRDEIMGHASTNMGRHYAHLPRQPLLDAVALLPERGFEPDPVLLEELAATWTNQQRRQILYANANGMPAMPPRRIIKKNTNGTSAASRKRIKKKEQQRYAGTAAGAGQKKEHQMNALQPPRIFHDSCRFSAVFWSRFVPYCVLAMILLHERNQPLTTVIPR